MKRQSDIKKILAGIGSVVKTERHRLGITQEELAHRSGLHRTYVTDIERGTRNMTVGSATKLSTALAVPLGWLFANGDRTAGAQPGNIGPTFNALANIRILLVDSDENDIELITAALTSKGVSNTIIPLRTGEAALMEVANQERSSADGATLPSCLILLDLGLSDIAGVAVLREIRSDEYGRSIPVIVLTDAKLSPDFGESAELGVTAYLKRPVDFSEFCSIVQKVGVRLMLTSNGTS